MISVVRILVALAFAMTLSHGADYLPGWPMPLTYNVGGAPTVADLNGDGLPELIVNEANERIHAFAYDGTELPGWPVTFIDIAPRGNPMVGDLDGDGGIDVVFRSHGYLSLFRAIDSLGQVRVDWPIDYPDWGSVSPNRDFAMGDLDGDGADEVLVLSDSSERTVYALGGDGYWVPGWPFEFDLVPPLGTTGLALQGISVGDLDFDGSDEVVVGITMASGITPIPSPQYVLNGDGTIRDGWPVTPLVPIWAAPNFFFPILADLDGDFACELTGRGDSMAVSYHADGSFNFFEEVGGWRQPSACGDLDGDGDLEFVFTGWRLQIVDHEGHMIAATDEGGPYHRFYGLSLGDVNGDGLQEICAVSTRTNGLLETVVHILDLDLQGIPGWPKVVSPADPAKSGTALADLDGDDDLEVIFAGGVEIHVWDEPNPGLLPPTTEWPMRGHDPSLGSFYHHGEPLPQPKFIRGDANHDGRVNVADAMMIMMTLADASTATSCPESLDVNPDGQVDLADAIDLLTHVYLGGPAPDAPYPECNSMPGMQLGCSTLACP